MHPGGMTASACDGCLGDRDCWVCLGIGHVEVRRGDYTPCHRCGGTGRCAECAEDGRAERRA